MLTQRAKRTFYETIIVRVEKKQDNPVVALLFRFSAEDLGPRRETFAKLVDPGHKGNVVRVRPTHSRVVFPQGDMIQAEFSEKPCWFIGTSPFGKTIRLPARRLCKALDGCPASLRTQAYADL